MVLVLVVEILQLKKKISVQKNSPQGNFPLLFFWQVPTKFPENFPENFLWLFNVKTKWTLGENFLGLFSVKSSRLFQQFVGKGD